MMKFSIGQCLIVRKRFVFFVRLTIILLISIVLILFCHHHRDHDHDLDKSTNEQSPHVIVITICGDTSFHQAIIALKSILIFTQQHHDDNPSLHFIIMTDWQMMATISRAVIID